MSRDLPIDPRSTNKKTNQVSMPHRISDWAWSNFDPRLPLLVVASLL